ncbi:site-specific integrase [Azospirillum tabaci]|uniref:site-specific integrase n=1 Tax=Azospirillum tabaci TaxID=2752310 RepID=UPI00166169E5|nr:tyrosine-type recombinase/integrase [Azospirillum tabaci]
MSGEPQRPALPTRVDSFGLPADLAAAVEKAKAYADAALTANTRRAYASDWRAFTAWCAAHGLDSLPAAPDTVVLYLTDLAGRLKPSTLERRLVAIGRAHTAAGHPAPRGHAAVGLVRRGIRATHGTAPAKKAGVGVVDLRHMLAALPADCRGARDRALLLLGFAGGFRRAELAGLDLADLEPAGDGLRVTIRRSKTDREGRGRTIAIRRGRHPETDPVAAVQAWIAAAGLVAGPLFRGVRNNGVVEDGRLSDRTVALVVKRAVARVGLKPERFAGHSLRRGLATAAAEHGAPERVIMRQTGDRSERVMRGYIEEGQLFQDDVGRYLPL